MILLWMDENLTFITEGSLELFLELRSISRVNNSSEATASYHSC